jgi:hypothetical protein
VIGCFDQLSLGWGSRVEVLRQVGDQAGQKRLDIVQPKVNVGSTNLV